MIERNKGDTKESGFQLVLKFQEVEKFRNSLFRILEKIEVQTSDQTGQDDIKSIYKLLDYLAKPK